MPKEMKNANPHNGFSLIEVMIATLILMILVMMTGAVFRTGASAWDAGYAKAEGSAIVRTIVGSIQRELSLAIDGRFFGTFTNDDNTEVYYGEGWDYKVTPINLGPTLIDFIYYRENLSKRSDSMGEPAPVRVQYHITGSTLQRKEAVLEKDNNGMWMRPVFSEERTMVDFGGELSDATAGSTVVVFNYNPERNSEKFSRKSLAEQRNIVWDTVSVTLTVKIFRSLKTSTISVRSFGPNGQSGSVATEKDDIYVAW